MTRKNKLRWSKICNAIILVIIIGVLGVYVFNVYKDYKQDKDDERLANELEILFANEISLYEEVIPTDEEHAEGTVTVLPPTNQDLLTANLSYIGIIEIPRIGIRKPIVQGTTRKDIANKVGWDKTTPLPGHEGNSVLAAHNSSSFFRYIYKMKNGDTFTVTTREGTFVYKVWDVFKVYKTDVWIFDEVAGHDKMMTLITCNKPDPNYRWIVRGDLIES